MPAKCMYANVCYICMYYVDICRLPMQTGNSEGKCSYIIHTHAHMYIVAPNKIDTFFCRMWNQWYWPHTCQVSNLSIYLRVAIANHMYILGTYMYICISISLSIHIYIYTHIHIDYSMLKGLYVWLNRMTAWSNSRFPFTPVAETRRTSSPRGNPLCSGVPSTLGEAAGGFHQFHPWNVVFFKQEMCGFTGKMLLSLAKP